MAYVITNSRGQTIATLETGTENTTATSLTLLGAGFPSYGEQQNENFVYLLENFANTAPPNFSIPGQLWFNTATNTLNQRTVANTWVSLATQDYVQAQKVSPAFTGVPTAPTAANGTVTGQLATTQFVTNTINNAGLAPINSPAFTGVPTAATAANTTANTQVATTAFVVNYVNDPNLSIYATKASPTFTGNASAPTATAGSNTTQIATTAFVTSAISQIDLTPYATKASPAFTGVPTAPTAANTTSNTQIATTAFVTNYVNDPNLSIYATKASPTFTGTPQAPTPTSTDSSAKIATTAYVQAQKISPTFTGTPIAPTAASGTNTTQIATTAFVKTAIDNIPLSAASEMAGSIKMWAAASPPDGWALCNGQAVSRTTYATLFSRIGTTFGSGDGSTTFNLPDFRNRFPVGAGSTYNGGATGGFADAAVITHTHAGSTNTAGDHQHSHVDRYFPVVAKLALQSYVTNKEIMPASPPYNGYLGEGAADRDNNYWLTYNDVTGSAGNHNHSVSISAPDGSVSGTGRNLPPYLAGWWIIKLSDDGSGGGTLQAGGGIDITTGNGYSIITNTGVKSLTAGSGISITGSSGNLTITNTGSLPTLNAGQGISIVQNGTTFTITNTVATTPIIAGAGISVVNAPGGATVTAQVANLQAGAGISITNNAGTYTISRQATATGALSAWVRMNRINGVLTILGSYNINAVSLSDNYYYRFTFETPMDNANYCVVASVFNNDSTIIPNGNVWISSQTTSNFTVFSRAGSGLNVMVTGGV